jgi:hypothetical protein
MLRLPLSWLSPGGPRGRLSILIFHRVLPEPDALIPELPDAAEFEATMRWVRDWFNVLPPLLRMKKLTCDVSTSGEKNKGAGKGLAWVPCCTTTLIFFGGLPDGVCC